MSQGEKRVIDTNSLMEKRLEKLAQEVSDINREGFVSGLIADEISMEEYAGETSMEGEEGDFAQLSGNVIKAANEEPEQTVARAKEEAQSILELAQKEAAQLLEETRGQVEQERAQALEEARRQGYEEGSVKARKEAEASEKALRQKERQLEEVFQKKIDELEPRFIDVLTDIYKQIFHVELENYRDILVYLIANTIRSVEGSHEFIIHVSKEDYPFVSLQKKQLAAVGANYSLEIIEDMALNKNECMIETESGIFDCGVDTQLEELTRRLKLLAYQK